MATKNPFGNLRINRDDDDDDDFVRVTPQNTHSASNYTSGVEAKDKKKKKVRPEENKKPQENTAEVSEGFEVVGKTKQRPYTARNNNAEEGEQQKEKREKHKGTGNRERQYNKARPNKRQYERHSGTGRGKETSKGGAGGKTVWGDNPNQIARDAKNSRDDYCKFLLIFYFIFLINFFPIFYYLEFLWIFFDIF